MARIGRLQVSCDYGDGSDPYVSTYRIVEIESAGKTFVGHTSEEGSQNGITWFDDADLSLASSLDGMYRFGGTNTYTWLAAMTEVPDDSVDIEYPISIANGGTGATTAAQALTNLGAASVNHTHDYAASDHTHSGYAASSHTHTIANITNLQSALDGKASADHTHATPCCTITGSASSQSVAAGTMTRVSLNTFVANTDTSCFSAYDNGVKVAEAGYYQISASAYMTCSATSGIRVLHVHQNSTEITTVRSEEGGSYASQGGIATAPKVVYLNAGDVIYLKVRSMVSAATLAPNNCATYLSIVKM